MRGADRRAAPQLSLDHRLKAIVAECALLLKVGADVVDLRLPQDVGEQRTIGALSLFTRGAERQIVGVWAQQRIERSSRICCVAGPGKVCGWATIAARTGLSSI